MSVEENKAIVQRAFDSMSAGKDEFLRAHDEIYDPNLVGHFPGMPPVGIDMHRQFGLATYAAFSNLQRPVAELLADGDKVVARWTSTGVHTGDWMGIPPTGKSLTTSGITIFRLAGGKVVEEWSESDMAGMLMQVGALPGPGSGQPAGQASKS